MAENTEKDKTKIKVIDLLKSHPEGLTIADIMERTGLARHTILARLHGLIGAEKVGVRKINMAKLHHWKDTAPPGGEEMKKAPLHTHHEDIKVQPIQEKHLKEISKTAHIKKEEPVDMAKIKKEIEEKLKGIKGGQKEKQILEQREPIKQVLERAKEPLKKFKKEFVKTGIPGLDALFEQGIPKGSAVLVAGGAGSGKTILSLEILNYHALQGKKCLYMSFEESEEHLIEHMKDFSWNPHDIIKKGNFLIKRFNPFDITRSVDALLMKAKGELLIDIEPVIFPIEFTPDFIVVDSLTAIASAFTGKEDSYRIYIEQLFRFFEKINATSFLITETKQIPTIFSQSGVEEFLADGVIVLYSIKRGNIRENAIEVLKLRGARHQKKIVAMQVTETGIVVYPEQEVFGGLEERE